MTCGIDGITEEPLTPHRHDHDKKRDEFEHVRPQGVRQPRTGVLPDPGNWQNDGEYPDRRDHKCDAASSPDSYNFLLTCHGHILPLEQTKPPYPITPPNRRVGRSWVNPGREAPSLCTAVAMSATTLQVSLARCAEFIVIADQSNEFSQSLFVAPVRSEE